MRGFVHPRTHSVKQYEICDHLRNGPIQDADDRILSVYTEMYDAYFAERELIPEGRLCEVSFEDLERDPLNVVGSIYNALRLPHFEEARPLLETYVKSIADYRKNRHDELAEPLRRRIANEWGRSFDEWGYER